MSYPGSGVRSRCAIALALTVTPTLAAQDGPLRAAVVALDSPGAATAQARCDDLAIAARTLCEPQRCGFVWPGDDVPRRSSLKTGLVGGAVGLALGGMTATDDLVVHARPKPIRWWDVALIGAGAFASKGRDLFIQHEAPRLGEGRWTDCVGASDHLGRIDAFWRDRLAGEPAKERCALSRALRRREQLDHFSSITLAATVMLPVGFTLRSGSAKPWRDAVVYAEAAAVSGGLTSLAKRHFHRPRPFAHRCEPVEAGELGQEDAQQSFFSGHAATSFALATAGWRLAQMRGDHGARWLKGSGIALATTTAALRMAADKHYFTDVLVGAAVGWGTGFLVTKLHQPERGTAPAGAATAQSADAARAALTPAGGLAFGLPRGTQLQVGLVAGGPAFALHGRF